MQTVCEVLPQEMKCQNEGTCIADKLGQPRCLCTLAFTGSLCTKGNVAMHGKIIILIN